MDKTISNNYKYRKEIDGLRAIAVIAVIINHFNKDLLPNGYLGVDMFFVISGYVITLSIQKIKSKNLLDFLLIFYERRLKRILPLLITFVLSISLLICMLNPFPIFHLRTAFLSLLGLSNIFLFKVSQGYFTIASDLNPFTHTWSLGVEGQFYFIYPLIAWVSGYKSKKNNGSKNLVISLLILASISFLLFIYYYPINQNAAYFLIPARFWEIAAGCLTYIGFSKRLKIIDFVKNFNGNYIFLLLICILCFPVNFPIISTASVVLFTTFLILAIDENNFIYKLLTNKFILKIGLMSYSLYLWHWGIISLSKWSFGIYWWSIPIQIFLICLISYLSYKYIEYPIRNIEKRSKFFSFIMSFILIVFGQIIILFLGSNGKRMLFLGNLSGIYKRDLISKTIYLNQCNLIRKDFKKVSENKNCSDVSNLERTRFILIGDSHANMFFKPFKNLIKNNYLLTNFTGDGCSFPLSNSYALNESKVCVSQMQKAKIWIEENIYPGDKVFIGNHKINTRVHSLLNKNLILADDQILLNYFQSLNNFSDLVLEKGGSVHFFVDGPVFNSVTDAYCSEEWFRPKSLVNKKCFLDRNKFEKRRNYFISFLYKINENKYNIFHDYLNLICDQKICSAKGYHDSNHFLEDLGFKILKESYLGIKLN